MADLNGAGNTTFGGLQASAAGQTQWWKVTVTTPDAGYISPGLDVTVGVTADTWDDTAVPVRIQVSTSPAFGSTVYDQTVSAAGNGATETAVQVTGLVDGTTYYVRARVQPVSGYVGPWAPTVSFRVLKKAGIANEYVYVNVGVEVTRKSLDDQYVYVNAGVEHTPKSLDDQYVYESVGVEVTLDSAAIEYGYEGDVNTLTPQPIIWFLMPGSGRAGDGIQIVGWGFGDLQTTYTGEVEVDFGGTTGWQAVPVSSWQTFPADPPAYGPDRVLDPVTGQVDMQHTIITIVVPADALPPGYPVRVKTNGP